MAERAEVGGPLDMPTNGAVFVTARRSNVDPFGDGLFSALIGNVTWGLDVFFPSGRCPVSGPRFRGRESISVVRVRSGVTGAMIGAGRLSGGVRVTVGGADGSD